MEKLSRFSRLYNKLYYNLFIEFNNNRVIDYKFTNQKRWDLIDQIIQLRKIENYLEIGCDDNFLFNKVNVANKIGVDPNQGGNVKKTSDSFFNENNKKFDLIFIDGLHEFDQVNKDIENSLNCLKDNGFILLHDCLPCTMRSQAVPRYSHFWNGDVWKSIVKFRHKKDLKIYTITIDQGISVIKKSKNENEIDLNIKDFKKLKFNDLVNNYKEFMNLISYDDFIVSLKNHTF